MDGLEAVEVKLSVLSNVIDYRIEAEYFLKKFLRIDSVFARSSTSHFLDHAKVSYGVLPK